MSTFKSYSGHAYGGLCSQAMQACMRIDYVVRLRVHIDYIRLGND